MMPLFDYYMVRVTRTEEPAHLAGLVERLGTGEKRSFSSGEQLLGLVATWADPDSNLQVPLGSGNPAGSREAAGE